MDILTLASQGYLNTFGQYVSQFLTWGKWIFASLLSIQISWMCLWYAFDKQSFVESMSGFIKQFAGIALFYTLMLHHEWLIQLVKTSEVMGTTLTHLACDPSSLIKAGIGLGNKIIEPVKQSSLLVGGFSVILLSLVYVGILFVFMSIALELALTLIITSALISISPLLLSFSALNVTSQIAKQTLDVILANAVKLLGIYLVVAAGSSTISALSSNIPNTMAEVKAKGFDPYVWIMASSILFWLLSRNLPNQLSKIVTLAIQENRGTSAGGLALAALQHARTAFSAIQSIHNKLAPASNTALKTAGATLNNAAAHFMHDAQEGNLMTHGVKSAGKALGDLAGATKDRITSQYKHLMNKASGGEGLKERTPEGKEKALPSVANRLHTKSQDLKPKEK